MKERVFFIEIEDNEQDDLICYKLEKAIRHNNFFSFIDPEDMVAIKTHFGEQGTKGYVRPVYFKMIGEIVKEQNAKPFLTETSTLYKSKRSNAVDHIHLAYEHGFNYKNTGLPIIMSDGLFGDEEIQINIPGKIYKKVGIASLIVKAQSLIVVSHFTGHIVTGFGGALKNMGMGCSSRKGKLIQHSTAKPTIIKKNCTGCKECIKWCPAGAISFIENRAVINVKKCIGCGECLAVCRFNAVKFNWKETYEQLQKKIVEHAMGVVKVNKGKIIYINFLNRITKDCDCMKGFEKITSDIGVLISFDPVAIDAASLDLVEKRSEKRLPDLSYNIPYKIQIDHSRDIGFGNPDYKLINLKY